MKKQEIAQLDQMYQIILLNKYAYNSILEGTADCAHHFKRKPDSLRWWLPGGVLLNTEDHNIIHSSDERGKEMEKIIIAIKGKKWNSDLEKRKHITVKYLTFEKVKSYLNGEIEDYI